MKLTRWDPFRDAEDVFDRYAKSLGWPLCTGHEVMPYQGDWAPRVDVSETDNHFNIVAEVPGINRENVKISVDAGVLTIHGERKEEKEEKGRKFHRTERYYGSFSRSFSLPENVDENHIEATFKEGLLTLQIPKIAAVTPKSIEVKIH